MTSDGEFKELIDRQRAFTGAQAEAIVVADLMSHEYLVCRPWFHITGYDLIVDTGDKLIKILIKVGSRRTLQVMLPKKRVSRLDSNMFVRTELIPKHSENDFDYMAVVDRDTKDVYYVKYSEIDHSKSSFSVKITEKDRFKVF